MVRLICSDSCELSIHRNILEKYSKTVTDMLDCVDEDDDTSIIIPNSTRRIVQKLVNYCYETEDCCDFDTMSHDEIHQLIFVANFLEVLPLLQELAQHIYKRIRGTSVTEVRRYLRLENDFTDEQVLIHQREFDWSLPR